MFNSRGWVASLPLGRLVVGVSPFSLRTGMFCSISSVDDRTVIPP